MPFHYTCEFCHSDFFGRHSPGSGRNRFCSKACWYSFNTEPPEIKFWRFVQKGPNCWLWVGTKMGRYGCFQYRKDGSPIKEYAHRFSWMLVNGLIPPDINILHDCPNGDNPLCIKPDHLWPGSHTDNMRDMIEKGRHRWGPNRPSLILKTGT